MKHNEASKLFTRALKKVESKSIRDWARKQRPVWVQIVQDVAMSHGYVKSTPELELRIATLITLQAMG